MSLDNTQTDVAQSRASGGREAIPPLGPSLADFRARAQGNPLSLASLKVLMIEGISDFITPEQYIARFARAYWYPRETADALAFITDAIAWLRSQQEPTPTPIPFMTNTPQPMLGVGFDDLDTWFPGLRDTLGNYFYRLKGEVDNDPNALGKPITALGDERTAMETLIAFLDPNGLEVDPQWWHDDKQVTMDEIIVALAFLEGRRPEDAAVRLAIYTRALLYLGGAPGDRVDISKGFDPALDSAGHNTGLDRMLRFLAYYQTWNQLMMPGKNFDTTLTQAESLVNQSATEDIRNEVQRLYSDPQRIYAELSGGKTILPTGMSFQNAPFDQLAKLPFHFGTYYRAEWSDKIQTAISDNNVGTGPEQVYDIVYDSKVDKYTVVLTPEQATHFCISTDKGVTAKCLKSQ